MFIISSNVCEPFFFTSPDVSPSHFQKFLQTWDDPLTKSDTPGEEMLHIAKSTIPGCLARKTLMRSLEALDDFYLFQSSLVFQISMGTRKRGHFSAAPLPMGSQMFERGSMVRMPPPPNLLTMDSQYNVFFPNIGYFALYPRIWKAGHLILASLECFFVRDVTSNV